MSNIIYNGKIKVNCPLICDKSGYYHLIYCIANKMNGKIYIGKHTTKDPYDKYMGSGKLIIQAIKKYGIENFTKEILYCFTNEIDAFLKEEELVTLEFIDRSDTYNMVVGGHGFRSEGTKGARNPFYNKHHTQELRAKMSKTRKGKFAGENHPLFGKHHTQESRAKMSKSAIGKHSGKQNGMYGRDQSDEKNPNAKTILKLDEFNNIIFEYETMKKCMEQEDLYPRKLRKLIKNHILYNGFYFEFKYKK